MNPMTERRTMHAPHPARPRMEPASGVRMLCACCSEGTHQQERTVHGGAQQVSLAAPEQEARLLPERWAGERVTGRSWSGLRLLVG